MIHRPILSIVGLIVVLAVGLLAYSPLGRGFLTGAIQTLADIDGRRSAHPRFQEANFAANRALVAKIEALVEAGRIRLRPILMTTLTTVLGLLVTDSGKARNGVELTFMSSSASNHHQFVLVTGRPDTSGFNPINQISFMVDTLSDLRTVHNRALDHGATDMRVVTHGNAWSCYFKDPEGNTVGIVQQ